MVQLVAKTTQTRGIGLPHLSDIATLFIAVNGSGDNNVQTMGQGGTLPAVGGSYFITAPTAIALTLPAPLAGATGAGQDGMVLKVFSNTAFAHTISAPGLFLNGTGAKSTATFTSNAGVSMSLVAYGGKWMVLAATGVTFS